MKQTHIMLVTLIAGAMVLMASPAYAHDQESDAGARALFATEGGR